MADTHQHDGQRTAVTARPGTEQPTADAVWSSVAGVYAGYLGGEVAAVDACLDPDVTIWNHDHAPLLLGLTDLHAVRVGRGSGPASGPAVAALTPRDVLVDGNGDVAWCRHLLGVAYDDGTSSTARVTDVLRRRGDRWLVVHHHEEELQAEDR